MPVQQPETFWLKTPALHVFRCLGRVPALALAAAYASPRLRPRSCPLRSAQAISQVNKLLAVVNAQLAVDVLRVPAHGVLGNVQPRRDG